MVFKFNLIRPITFPILGILFGLVLVPAVFVFFQKDMLLGTALAVVFISPFTLNKTCETNFDKGVYIFRLQYLFILFSSKTYKISDFHIYSYKRHSIGGRRIYSHTNTTLKVHNPEMTKTIALGDEFAIQKLITALKSEGYTWTEDNE